MIYYNEFDKGKAAWLRELMKRGAIAPGDVDERSIADVTVDDLRGYTRCHFFAGIGLWDRALIEAGWPEDREIWTGSCPCQPFSTAGRRKGKADERHLWPVLARLIAARRPQFLIGEQVSGADGLAWLDDVFDDLGDCDYTAGAQSAPACGVGAPHRRERLYWVAFASGARLSDGRIASRGRSEPHIEPERLRDTLRTVGDARSTRLEEWQCQPGNDGSEREAVERAGGGIYAVELTAGDGREQGWAKPIGRGASSGCGVGGVAESLRTASERHTGGVPGAEAPISGARESDGSFIDGLADGSAISGVEHAEQGGLFGRRIDNRSEPKTGQGNTAKRSAHWERIEARGPVNGYWRDAAWIYCKDGKYRAVESTPCQLADGTTADLGRVRYGDSEITHPLQTKGKSRVLRLRGAGDAIVLPQAVEWIKAVMSVCA